MVLHGIIISGIYDVYSVEYMYTVYVYMLFQFNSVNVTEWEQSRELLVFLSALHEWNMKEVGVVQGERWSWERLLRDKCTFITSNFNKINY